ncbi:putative phosphinothricin N-acetyltransferase [Acinetobacter sp. HA]|uniref:GNAT family N-acetyltransferase n=1 Tax=unclassified Acinetobacter TaxID=196816 RepID=UPI000263DCDC|nr:MULTISPECIES: GNAT family N-acetyltransferase [unclassified Acinetobacter]EIM38841.1 putative phosphinothricin N-acetyltransferase [Acinetobacter sp. HA]RAZ03643.1 N-acetyltransferase [Acinetobacter sp. SM1B]
MSAVQIRTANIDDLESILNIYNQEIINGTATWNHTAMAWSDIQAWFKTLQDQNYPVLVAEHQPTAKIIGYANYDEFRSIQGFSKTIEHAVFLHPDYTGQGIGEQLLLRLMEIASRQGMHIMVAAIDSENIASIHLHRKLGFIQTGYMPQVGEKFGQWRDLVLLQLNLDQNSL